MENYNASGMQVVRERIDLADGKTFQHLLEQRYTLLVEQITKSFIASFATIETDVVPLMGELVRSMQEGQGLIEHAGCCDPKLANTVNRLSQFMKEFERLLESYSRLLVTQTRASVNE